MFVLINIAFITKINIKVEKSLQHQLSSLSKVEGSSIDPQTLHTMISNLDLQLNQNDPDQKKALLHLLIQDINVSITKPRKVTTINLAFDIGQQDQSIPEGNIAIDEEGFNSFMVRFTF